MADDWKGDRDNIVRLLVMLFAREPRPPGKEEIHQLVASLEAISPLYVKKLCEAIDYIVKSVAKRSVDSLAPESAIAELVSLGVRFTNPDQIAEYIACIVCVQKNSPDFKVFRRMVYKQMNLGAGEIEDGPAEKGGEPQNSAPPTREKTKKEEKEMTAEKENNPLKDPVMRDHLFRALAQIGIYLPESEGLIGQMGETLILEGFVAAHAATKASLEKEIAGLRENNRTLAGEWQMLKSQVADLEETLNQERTRKEGLDTAIARVHRDLEASSVALRELQNKLTAAHVELELHTGHVNARIAEIEEEIKRSDSRLAEAQYDLEKQLKVEIEMAEEVLSKINLNR